ncbi:MAG: hypothetical protein ABSB15_20120 [Bryobacteraceae bacterium]
MWSGNGQEAFFRGEDNRIIVVDYAAKGDSFVPDKPTVWPDKRLLNLGNVGNYDPPPDSKRIAPVMKLETPEAQPDDARSLILHVTANWWRSTTR